MKYFLSISVIIVCTMMGFSQKSPLLYTIKAKVIDKGTNETLPYANVFNKKRLKGTATNLEGHFELPQNNLGDTIIISYLGYEDYILVISSQPITIIPLSPNSNKLSEVVVTSNNDYLYRIVSKVRSNQNTKPRNAKTYLYLETYLNDNKAEIIESYYNGGYSNYCINELKYKKGRIGLKPIGNRFFSSTESSRLFSMHNIFASDKYFPDNPLSLSREKLKKNYTLKLDYIYDENDSKIYVISFSPTNNQTKLFGGTLWVNKENYQLIKINLKINNSSTHPFLLIGNNDIQEVDIAITKYYDQIQGKQYINKVHFNYGLTYTDKSRNPIRVNTKAFIKAYDYNSLFILPYFEFTKHFHEDYRNLTLAPYDSVFWDKSSEFGFYTHKKNIENFIKNNLFDNKQVFPQNSNSSYQPQLEFPYIKWSKERVKMRQASKEAIEKSIPNNFESDRFKLNTQLYLDINKIQDSLTFQVVAILDPIKSFYYFQMNKEDHAFINMYFDLLEIQKRKLEMELDMLQSPSIDAINSLYKKHLEEYSNTCKLFVKETNRGYDKQSMKKWNKQISDILNINNLHFFEIVDPRK